MQRGCICIARLGMTRACSLSHGAPRPDNCLEHPSLTLNHKPYPTPAQTRGTWCMLSGSMASCRKWMAASVRRAAACQSSTAAATPCPSPVAPSPLFVHIKVCGNAVREATQHTQVRQLTRHGPRSQRVKLAPAAPAARSCRTESAPVRHASPMARSRSERRPRSLPCRPAVSSPPHTPAVVSSQPHLRSLSLPGRGDVPPARSFGQATLLRGLRCHQGCQRGAAPGRVANRVSGRVCAMARQHGLRCSRGSRHGALAGRVFHRALSRACATALQHGLRSSWDR